MFIMVIINVRVYKLIQSIHNSQTRTIVVFRGRPMTRGYDCRDRGTHTDSATVRVGRRRSRSRSPSYDK